MLDNLKRFRNVVILAVFCSGLADVLIETLVGEDLPYGARITLRTVFWVSALLWITLRISELLSRRTGTDTEQK